MPIEDDLAALFREKGWKWSLRDNRFTVPTVDDIEAALDEAARLLYNEPVGTQLEVGRLIIKRLHDGFDVYVYAGPYK